MYNNVISIIHAKTYALRVADMKETVYVSDYNN